MVTLGNLNNINNILINNRITNVKPESESFDDWMKKIQNIHTCDNEAMCAAYDRIENPNLKIPLVRKIKFKNGRYPQH